MITTTVRFPEELYQQLADYAKENDFSKNQVIKMALREYLRKKVAGEPHGDDGVPSLEPENTIL